jgi:hypothetical protein
VSRGVRHFLRAGEFGGNGIGIREWEWWDVSNQSK